MANGYRCNRKGCGYQEADHEVVGTRRFNVQNGTKEEKKKVDDEVKLEFPGICRRFINRDPKAAYGRRK